MPLAPGELKVRHILLEADDKNQIYSIRGVPQKIFRNVGMFFKFYEENNISPNIGTIGVPLSPNVTHLWYPLNITREERARQVPEENGCKTKDSDHEKQGDNLKSQSVLTPEHQKELTLAIKDAIMEPLTEQHRAYQDQLEELRQANKELKDELEKQQKKTSCIIQ